MSSPAGTAPAKRERHPQRMARFRARLAENTGAHAYFLRPAAAYRHDAEKVLRSIHKWIRTRKYAPSADDLSKRYGLAPKPLRKYLDDLELAGQVVRIARGRGLGGRWVLSPAGAETIRVELVTPLLPPTHSERIKVAGLIRRAADDDIEIARLRQACGVESNEALYQKLFHRPLRRVE